MKEEQILIQDIKTNYKIAGSGPAILVLHGWGGSSDSWIEVMKILSAKGYKIICPDLPGFGKSVTPAVPWGIADYVSWLKAFSDALDLTDFYLIAHSFGGQIAVKFTVDYPAKVKKIIFCASAAIRPKPGLKTKMIYRVAKLGNAIFSPKYLVRLKDGARNFLYVFLRNRDYKKANGTMKETIKKVLVDDLLPDLSKIKKETLLIWGSVDKLVPIKNAHIFKEKIENSRLEVLPKTGHSPHLEVPEKLSEIILRFLRL